MCLHRLCTSMSKKRRRSKPPQQLHVDDHQEACGKKPVSVSDGNEKKSYAMSLKRNKKRTWGLAGPPSHVQGTLNNPISQHTSQRAPGSP